MFRECLQCCRRKRRGSRKGRRGQAHATPGRMRLDSCSKLGAGRNGLGQGFRRLTRITAGFYAGAARS
eukprot:364533-Chlamydomonas_euryale.AAC.11